jgi:hypothetical protein
VDVRDNAPLIAAGGGLLLFISLFLSWVGAEGIDSLSAWEFFDLLDIVLALLGLIAVAIGVMLFTGNTANLPAAPGAIVTTAGLIAFSMVATHVLDPFTIAGESVDREFGLFVALIGTIAMIVGGMQLASPAAATAGRRTPASEAPTATAPPPPPPPSSSTGGGPGTGA